MPWRRVRVHWYGSVLVPLNILVTSARHCSGLFSTSMVSVIVILTLKEVLILKSSLISSIKSSIVPIIEGIL